MIEIIIRAKKHKKQAQKKVLEKISINSSFEKKSRKKVEKNGKNDR